LLSSSSPSDCCLEGGFFTTTALALSETGLNDIQYSQKVAPPHLSKWVDILDWMITHEAIQVQSTPFSDGIAAQPATRARVVKRLRLATQYDAEQQQRQHHHRFRLHNVILQIAPALTNLSPLRSEDGASKAVRQARACPQQPKAAVGGRLTSR
jgi:hypothetical protein